MTPVTWPGQWILWSSGSGGPSSLRHETHIVNHSVSELSGSAVNNMAFVSESLGFGSGDARDCDVTACGQPVSGSESS